MSLNNIHSFANPPKEGSPDTHKTDAKESKVMKDLIVAAQSSALNSKEVMKLFATEMPSSLFNMDRKEHEIKTLRF